MSILTDRAVRLDVLLGGKCMSYLQPPTVPQSDGFILGGLEYVRFSGDPAQVSDLEKAKVSKLLHTTPFLRCKFCKCH